MAKKIQPPVDNFQSLLAELKRSAALNKAAAQKHLDAVNKFYAPQDEKERNKCKGCSRFFDCILRSSDLGTYENRAALSKCQLQMMQDHKPVQKETFDESFLKAIEEQNKQIDKHTLLIDRLKIQIEQEKERQAEERRKKIDATVKDPCRFCPLQFECKLRKTSDHLRIQVCQIKVAKKGYLKINTTRSIELITGKNALKKDKKIWKKKLELFMNYRTKYDSGLDGNVYAKFSGGKIDLDELNGLKKDRTYLN